MDSRFRGNDTLNGMKIKLPSLYYGKFIRVISILGIAFILFLFPAPNVYFRTLSSDSSERMDSDIKLPDPPQIPVSISGQKPPDLTAEGIMIIDLPSNITLYEKHANNRFNPASTTKIITALVALDHYQLDDVLTVGSVETEGRTMKLVQGEKLTFESLLYGALLHSANDAAYTIAENYPGEVTNFVRAMNQKAITLNLKNTHFGNPIGFDDELTYTTPVELTKIAKAALSNKTLTKIVGTKSITVSDVDYANFHALTSVNELLGKIAGVAGVKTGYTENGGEILVSEIKKNGHSVLMVVLKSQDRFKETTVLIDWIFNNFVWKNITDIIPANR